MNTDRAELLHAELTDAVLHAFYAVYNELGHGFLEAIYENALAWQLQSDGVRIERQKPLTVFYRDQPVGTFRLDLLVEGVVIVEVKATASLALAHEAQLLNYLHATRTRVGLLLNFGPKPEFRRKLLAEHRVREDALLYPSSA